MAKKKQIDVKAKSIFKKPLKSCGPALDDLRRIRKNEQAKLYRLNKKFTGTKKKGEADVLRREIRQQSRAIESLSGNVRTVQNACININQVKTENRSLTAKNAAIQRRFNAMAANKGKGFNEAEFKKLQNAYQSNANKINGNKRRISDILYSVNKNLGFDPKVIAEKLDISKKDLEKYHGEDFPEDYFEDEEVTDEGQPEEEEFEADKDGYILELDEPFWTAQKDFDTNERGSGLDRYTRVTFEYDGKTVWRKGSQLSLVTLMASEAWRWASAQTPAGRSAIFAQKFRNEEQTKLKYVLY